MSFWVYSYCGNMTSYRFFSRWRPRSLGTTSGFVFVDVIAFRRSKSINKPNFVDINGQHYINLWLRYNDFWFGKQTSTILEFYFRFRSRPFSVICILCCISLPNFVQIGAATAEIYHRCRFSMVSHDDCICVIINKGVPKTWPQDRRQDRKDK